MNNEFARVEAYMRSCMNDSAHDTEHVYRVLNYARGIAKYESGVDTDILETACLLHDIARSEQFADPKIDHASAGAVKARKWLLDNGWDENFAGAVSACIHTHRYRSGNPPQSIEAKILFDADKIDVCGAMGIVRTIQYGSHEFEPVYTFNPDGTVFDGDGIGPDSFLHEYKYKLEKVYERFYTKRGAELGEKRRKAAADFYASLLDEIHECYNN